MHSHSLFHLLLHLALTHSQVALCLCVRWSGFQAGPPMQTHCSGWWMVVFGEQLCLASTPSPCVPLCVAEQSVWMSVCTLPRWPPLHLLHSSVFPLTFCLSDTLANTLHCPDWLHYRHLGGIEVRVHPMCQWYLQNWEVNLIKHQPRSACRQSGYCVSRTFWGRQAVMKFCVIGIRSKNANDLFSALNDSICKIFHHLAMSCKNMWCWKV